MKGKELRDWRARMGWSQVQAATALDVDRRAYQDMEADKSEIGIGISIRLNLFDYVRQHGASRGRTGEPVFDQITDQAEEIMARVDNMPKPGRPKSSLLVEVDRLLDYGDKAGRLLSRAMAEMKTKELDWQVCNNFLTQLEMVKALREATREAEAERPRHKINFHFTHDGVEK